MGFGGVSCVQTSNLHKLVFIVAFFFSSLVVTMSISNGGVTFFSKNFVIVISGIWSALHVSYQSAYYSGTENPEILKQLAILQFKFKKKSF